jgi:hypothetical protein
MKRLALVLVSLALIATACGGETAEPLIGIRASTDPAVGDSRLLFGVNEIGGERRGSPDEKVSVVASPLEDPSRSVTSDAVFTWIIEDAIGLYVADVPFDTPGVWQIDFEISTGEPTEPFLIDIKPEPATVAVGEPAPVVASPTLADRPLEELTTDSDPLASLYELSLDDALTNGRKTVVLFATPAFCTSAACGPLVNQTKELISSAPGVDFLHIEVYEGFYEDGFAPGPDNLAPAVAAFGLPTEPWMFVMDEHGIVIARLEGVLVEGELEQILGL